MDTTTGNHRDPNPFRIDCAIDFEAVRTAMQRAGFTGKAVAALLDGNTEQGMDRVCAVLRTADGTPLNRLIRLFVIGLPLAEDEVKAALAPADWRQLLDVGLLVETSHGIRSTARLTELQGLYMAGDFPPLWGTPFAAEHVMSVASSSTRFLAFITPRRPVDSMLDLCTGAGVHALLAARHARRIVATDYNPRALNFAALNSRLNGIANVRFVEGSFFEPVEGERFDLIVANPPFIISPRSELIFQNAGLEDDGVSELVVRKSAEHLAQGGFGVSLINWVHTEEGDCDARPRCWVENTGCDMMLLRVKDEDTLTYTTETLRQTEDFHGPDYERYVRESLAWYERRGIRRITSGAAFLRKRAGQQNWVRVVESPPRGLSTDADAQVQRLFAAEDYLRSLPDDAALLQERLVVHPDHVIEQHLAQEEGNWTIRTLDLIASHGIAFVSSLDAHSFALVAGCNGERTIAELIAGIAREAGADLQEATAVGLRIVKLLLRTGILVAPLRSNRR